MLTTPRVFGTAIGLTLLALVLALAGGDHPLISQVAYAVGTAAVVLFVLGLVLMTSPKKPR